MALSARVQMRRRSHAEGVPHLMRQNAHGAEVNAPACTAERLLCGYLETERAHGASGAAAHGTKASVRVAVGHAISCAHPEAHNPALGARCVRDAALLQGVASVAGVAYAVLHVLVVGCALLSEACEGFDAADCEANTELRVG